jgi:orotate phosphoribosyltransferase
MDTLKQQFIHFLIEADALRFGEFTLKSGRVSPYFFNAGQFNTGTQLKQLSQFYAETIKAANVDADVLFGPAYKGIPLASATAVALSDININMPYAFDRKETKDHGEGGKIVGANIRDKKILVIDDVITAGTAIRATAECLQQESATLSAVVIALDRKEKGTGECSAIQEIEQEYGIQVFSIISINDIIDYLDASNQIKEATAIKTYQQQYGINT